MAGIASYSNCPSTFVYYRRGLGQLKTESSNLKLQISRNLEKLSRLDEPKVQTSLKVGSSQRYALIIDCYHCFILGSIAVEYIKQRLPRLNYNVEVVHQTNFTVFGKKEFDNVVEQFYNRLVDPEAIFCLFIGHGVGSCCHLGNLLYTNEVKVDEKVITKETHIGSTEDVVSVFNTNDLTGVTKKFFFSCSRNATSVSCRCDVTKIEGNPKRSDVCLIYMMPPNSRGRSPDSLMKIIFDEMKEGVDLKDALKNADERIKTSEIYSYSKRTKTKISMANQGLDYKLIGFTNNFIF